jgi:hypothetical protein
MYYRVVDSTTRMWHILRVAPPLGVAILKRMLP